MGAGYSSLELLHFVCQSSPFLPQVVQFPCSAVSLTYNVRSMIFVYPYCSPIKRATTFKSPGSSTALHHKLMQTTLDDVCVIVLCNAVQNYIILGLFRMLVQSYSINFLGLTHKLS